ncbi:hypothetical protein Tco_0250952 [Tanacetum coccineum]
MFHLDCGSVVAIEKTGSDVVGMENEESDGDGPVNGGVGYGEVIVNPIRHMALPPRDQRHQYLRFEGLQYTDADIADFETMLGKIYRREMLKDRVYSLAELGGGYLRLEARWRRISWREFILGMGLHTTEEIKSVGFGAYWAESARHILDKRDLSAYWIGISFAEDFLGITPSYTSISDLILRLCHKLIACSITGRSQAPEKHGAMISGGQFVARQAEYFRLLTEERLQGLTVIVRDHPKIVDMAELVRLQICEELDDTWAWVAPGPERQQVVTAGAAEDAPVVDEGAMAVLAPVHAPQPSPPMVRPARTMAQRRKTDDSSTSIAQQDEQQPDP